MLTETQTERVPLPPIVPSDTTDNMEVDLCPTCHFYYKRSGATRKSVENGADLDIDSIEYCLVAPDKVADISDLFVFECSRYDKDTNVEHPSKLMEEDYGQVDESEDENDG